MPGYQIGGPQRLCDAPEPEYVAGHNKLDFSRDLRRLEGATLPAAHTHRIRSKARITERTQGMRKGLFALAAVGLLATGSLAACGDDKGGSDNGSGSGTSSVGKVGVILPDTKSSARWATADAKYLAEAFKAAGVEADI